MRNPRGEAVPGSKSQNYYRDDTCTSLSDIGETEIGWHVIWTRSNFEKVVQDQLLAKGYDVFLPMIKQWSVRQKGRAGGAVPDSKAKVLLNVPMFKGYLFLHGRIDKAAYLDISNTRGVAQILGVRWNRLARIPDDEIESIKLVADSHMPLLPHPYLKTGTKVRITRGTLANAQGVLVRSDFSKGLFVVSVSLLQRSVAVKVDCADVVPV